MNYLSKFKNIFKTPEQKFWDWFSDNSEKYYSSDRSSEDLLDELSERLKLINKNFCFQMSNTRKDGKRELVISADGIKESFPKLVDFVNMAPQLDMWEITAFRQRSENLDSMQLKIGNIELNFSDIYFNFDLVSDKIDLLLYIKDYDSEDDKFMKAIYIILDSVLGEYDVEMKIGEIRLFKLEENLKNDLLPLNRLPMIIDNYFKKD